MVLKFVKLNPYMATLNFAIILFVTLMALAVPAVFKSLIEGVLPDDNVRIFIAGSVLLVLIAIGRFLLGVVQDYIFLLDRQTIERRAVSSYLDQAGFKQGSLADTFSLARSYLSSFQYFWIQFVFYVAYAVFISIVVLVAFFFIEPAYFFLSVGFMALHAGNFYAFRSGVDACAGRFNADKAHLLTEITTQFKLLEEVRAVGKERFFAMRVETLAERFARAYLRRDAVTLVQQFVQNCLVNFFFLAFFFVALWLSTRKEMSLGSAALCLFLSNFLFEPIYRFSQIAKLYFDARGYSAWIPARPLLRRAGGTHADPVRLRFDGVRSRIMQMRGMRPLTAELAAGRLYLLKGPSGCGKTTLFDCIAGLEEIAEGEISLDGKTDFQSRIYYCEQDAVIFSGSLQDNVSFFQPEPESGAWREIVERLGLSGLDAGPERHTGVEGWSGGQRQRVSLARALHAEAAVYLFDEPTSALDSDNEQAALQLIKRLARDKLVILISHSPAAEAYADQCIVLQ